jgi:hypothetical protein
MADRGWTANLVLKLNFSKEKTMTKRLLAGMWVALAVVLFSGSAFAHPGHEHKVMGTVTMAAADHVMLKDTDGKDSTVVINKDTKFLRAKKAMKPADMKVGMRIVITAVTDAADDNSIAKVIERGPDVATKQ